MKKDLRDSLTKETSRIRRMAFDLTDDIVHDETIASLAANCRELEKSCYDLLQRLQALEQEEMEAK